MLIPTQGELVPSVGEGVPAGQAGPQSFDGLPPLLALCADHGQAQLRRQA